MSEAPLQPAGGPDFWTLERVAAALDAPGGEGGAAETSRTHRARPGAGGGTAGLGQGATLCGIATDSRTVRKGDVFITLAGDRFDGHAFLAAAVRNGAAAVVVSRPAAAAGLGVPVFTVSDPLLALGALARYRRRAWGNPVIAVAGSNGKTTTKDLVGAALASRLDVHATAANYNNRVGLPLTLLGVPDAADVAVVEIGTNAPGEVAMLRAIAEPDIAIVTSIGEEHLEGFGSLAGVLAEESEIFRDVRVAIVPASDPALAAAARGRYGARHVVEAGLDGGDVRATSWHLGADGLGELVVDDVRVAVPLRGVHNLRNAMLALAAARSCGVSLTDAAAGIARVTGPPMRADWTQLGRATLINDAYNSNPASARAALDLLGSVGQGRQRVVVLGTMRELGPAGPALHADIAHLALDAPVDVIAGVGEFAPALASAGASDPRVLTAPDVDDLWPRLRARLAPDAVILLKASRGVRLERLVLPITEWANS